MTFNWTLVSQDSFGYGTYNFKIDTNVEDLDKRTVVGLFTYLDDDNEIDIEFSRWGDGSNCAGNYVIQPGGVSGNHEEFDLNLTGDYSTHQFTWLPSEISFASWHGHAEEPAPTTRINEWNYSNGDNIPASGDEKVHLNFWLYEGVAPTDGMETEIVIGDFEFSPAVPMKPTISSPSDGSTGWPVDQLLSWSSGGGATEGYHVYMGTSTGSLTQVASVSGTTYDPSPDFAYDTTYYWRVDAHNGAGTTVTGDLWQFSTEELNVGPMPVILNSYYLDSVDFQFENDAYTPFWYINFKVPTGFGGDNNDRAILQNGNWLDYITSGRSLYDYDDRVALYTEMIRLAITEAENQSSGFEEKLNFLGIDTSNAGLAVSKAEEVLNLIEVYFDSKTVISYTDQLFNAAGEFDSISGQIKDVSHGFEILGVALEGLELAGNIDQLSAYTTFYLALDSELMLKRLSIYKVIEGSVNDPAYSEALDFLEAEFTQLKSASFWQANATSFDDDLSDIISGGLSFSTSLFLACSNHPVLSLAVTGIKGVAQLASDITNQWENLRRASLAATVYSRAKTLTSVNGKDELVHIAQGRLQSVYFWYMVRAFSDPAMGNFKAWIESQMSSINIITHFSDRYDEVISAINMERASWGRGVLNDVVPDVVDFVLNTSVGVSSPGSGTYQFSIGSEVTGGSASSPTTSIGTSRYRCIGYTGTGDAPSGSGLSYPSFTINQDSTLTWEWIPQYEVISGSGGNGDISPSGSSWSDAGGNLSYTASPNSGYQVDRWEVNGSVAQEGGQSYTLSDLSAPANVTVYFEVIPVNDTTPDAFTFTDLTGVARSFEQISTPITVSGINAAAPISIVGGSYSINGGAFLTSAGSVVNGDQVRVKLLASASYSATTEATLTIGGVSDSFAVTTEAESVNTPPVLDAIGAQSVNEVVEELTFTASATDSDEPAQTLTYSLTNEPSGASIHESTGVFTWTPTEAQGPASYTFTVSVSDGELSDSEDITVTVNEVNVAPVLDPIGDKNAMAQTELSFTATATDSDLPAQVLSFSLVDAPGGAAIDPSTGVFSWTPTEAQAGSSYTFTVEVSDGIDTDSEEIAISVDVGGDIHGAVALLVVNSDSLSNVEREYKELIEAGGSIDVLDAADVAGADLNHYATFVCFSYGGTSVADAFSDTMVDSVLARVEAGARLIVNGEAGGGRFLYRAGMNEFGSHGNWYPALPDTAVITATNGDPIFEGVSTYTELPSSQPVSYYHSGDPEWLVWRVDNSKNYTGRVGAKAQLVDHDRWLYQGFGTGFEVGTIGDQGREWDYGRGRISRLSFNWTYEQDTKSGGFFGTAGRKILENIGRLSSVSPAPVVLFEDDFSENLSQWTLWGSPQPSINGSLGNPAPSFSNNGDANYDSGAITKQSFDFSNGLVIEADAYQTEFGLWESFVVGLASKSSYGSTEGTGASVWVRSHHDNGDRTQFALRYSTTETESYDFDDADTNWRSYKIVIRPDRRVEFYKNAELLYTSTNALSLDYNNLPLIVGGRATSTVLVDNIKVSLPAATPSYSVTFDLGDHGVRSGGGPLIQTVESGQAAVAPTIAPNPGWQFSSWDTDFSAVSEDLLVGALYAEDPTTAPVSLDSSVLRFSSDGGSLPVGVNYPLGWAVSENLEWITVSPNSGSGDGSISVTSSSNATEEGRSGTVNVGNAVISIKQYGAIGSTDYQEWLLDQDHDPMEGHPKGSGGLDGILRYSLNLAKSDSRGVSDVIEMTPALGEADSDGCMVEFWTNDAATGVWTRPEFSEELGQWHPAESIKVVERRDGMTKWCAVYRPSGAQCFVRLKADEVAPPSVVSVSSSTTGSGTVSGAGEYTEGSTVTLRAVPADGFVFDGWSGLPEGVSGDSETVSFVVSSGTTPTASFAPEEILWEDFESGLDEWNILSNTIAPATVQTSNGVFHIKRSGAGGSGQSAGISKMLDVIVDAETYLEFDVRPIYSSVRNGAGDNMTEYPIYVELIVEDGTGADWVLRYAYNYRGGQNITNEDWRLIQLANGSVPQGEWLYDEKFIIRDQLPDAGRIKEIRVHGRGWDFEGELDNLEIK